MGDRAAPEAAGKGGGIGGAPWDWEAWGVKGMAPGPCLAWETRAKAALESWGGLLGAGVGCPSPGTSPHPSTSLPPCSDCPALGPRPLAVPEACASGAVPAELVGGRRWCAGGWTASCIIWVSGVKLVARVWLS